MILNAVTFKILVHINNTMFYAENEIMFNDNLKNVITSLLPGFRF